MYSTGFWQVVQTWNSGAFCSVSGLAIWKAGVQQWCWRCPLIIITEALWKPIWTCDHEATQIFNIGDLLKICVYINHINRLHCPHLCNRCFISCHGLWWLKYHLSRHTRHRDHISHQIASHASICRFYIVSGFGGLCWSHLVILGWCLEATWTPQRGDQCQGTPVHVELHAWTQWDAHD